MRDTDSFRDIHEQDCQREEGDAWYATVCKISGLLYDVVMASGREVKFTLEQTMKAQRGSTEIPCSFFFLTSTLNGVSGQGHAPAALPRE